MHLRPLLWGVFRVCMYVCVCAFRPQGDSHARLLANRATYSSGRMLCARERVVRSLAIALSRSPRERKHWRKQTRNTFSVISVVDGWGRAFFALFSRAHPRHVTENYTETRSVGWAPEVNTKSCPNGKRHTRKQSVTLTHTHTQACAHSHERVYSVENEQNETKRKAGSSGLTEAANRQQLVVRSVLCVWL